MISPFAQRTTALILVMLTLLWPFGVALNDSFSSTSRYKPLSVLQWEDKEWALVFRLTAHVQQSVYDTYVSTRNDDLPINRVFLPPGCLRPSGPCNTHYRSGLLDMWAYAGIDKVKLSIYKGGNRRAYIVFNGRNSDFLSWFSKDRVIESSWTNLARENFNFFSILGGAGTGHKRRFFICRSYNGCAGDNGWLAIGDTPEAVCPWESSSQSFPFPTILFSRRDTFAVFQSPDTETADVMTISVKFILKPRL